MTTRVLELYCGIGGCAAAVDGRADVVAAVDQNPNTDNVYAANFDHPRHTINLQWVAPKKLAAFDADMWWMSPPCQPYTVRGAQRDLTDRRAASFLHVLDVLKGVRPQYVALENVQGFHDSQARQVLLQTLGDARYHVHERLLCPTELGIPNRRPRYYLVASTDPLLPAPEPRKFAMPLVDYLDDDFGPELLVDEQDLRRYRHAAHILDLNAIEDVAPERGWANCFTSAYGKSIVQCGSYLRTDRGIRRFSPAEIARLLHFPADFVFPDTLSLRQKWKVVGNSLSVAAVREVLRVLAPFQ